MKNIFNLKRFGRLFVKHTVEQYKSYLMSLTVLIGVMVVGGGFWVSTTGIPIDKSSQSAIFALILLIAGPIFTSMTFADVVDKKQAIASLTLPVSHFEKYLVAWVYSFLIFLIVYTCSFYLVMLFAVNIRHFPGYPAEMINVFGWPQYGIYLAYAFLHAVAFFGAIYFEKLQFIKTAFLFFIFNGILIFLNKIILGLLFGGGVEATVPFGNFRYLGNGQVTIIKITQQMGDFLLILLMVWALIFWVATYYRLKEKQV